jgi:hypothetical protein
VIANPDGQDSGRVNITVRPKTGEMKMNTVKPDKSTPKDKTPPAGKSGAGA